jgi:FtsP/CotA-like multicopper oxidase with cupredoxin domain
VLTNGMNVGARAGSPSSPGALAPGAFTLPVQSGQERRLQLVNAATTRFFRLALTTSSGQLVPLVRVGGEAGLLNDAVVEGTVLPPDPNALNFDYGFGEILLPPGARADVVASIPAGTTGVLTLWTEDFSRTGQGFSNIPTVPVMHFSVTGAAAVTQTLNGGADLRRATGDLVPTLGAPTSSLLNPAVFVPAKLGLASQDVQLTSANGGTALGINTVVGTHDVEGDYTNAEHLGSTRYARVGDLLQLTVTNVTNAHHPFHLHGFSIQPVSLTKAASPTYTWPYREFRDNVDIPGGYTLTFRIKLEDRALADGTTAGGAAGRWVFHCHIFFHATNGMLGELTVVAASNGNEKPYVNANATKVAVAEGSAATMTGTFKDLEDKVVTLSASIGTVTDTGAGTWSWTRTAAVGDPRFVYITATDAGGRRDEAAFELAVAPIAVVPGPTTPALTLTPATATNPLATSHTVTATLANVTPLAGARILFSTAGAHKTSGSAATSATGAATYAYAGTRAGVDTISACYDANASTVCDAGELIATAQKRWVLPPFHVDQFKCYTVTPTSATAHGVTLTDQFGKRATRTGSRQSLCNPVSRNDSKILHSAAHLACYATRDKPGFRTRRVRVMNGFGTRVLSVLRPVSLCVPSRKRLLKPGGTTRRPVGPDPQKVLDHFRCYAVTKGSATRTIRTRDQFGGRTTKVVQVTRLCNPVRKLRNRKTTPVRRPREHLVCYSITERKPGPVRRVIIRNQFETRRLSAVRIQTLCLPSLKQDL